MIITSVLLTKSPNSTHDSFYPDGGLCDSLDSQKSEIAIMTEGNPLNTTLKEELLSIDGVLDVIEKREAFIGKVAVADGYSTEEQVIF